MKIPSGALFWATAGAPTQCAECPLRLDPDAWCFRADVVPMPTPLPGVVDHRAPWARPWTAAEIAAVGSGLVPWIISHAAPLALIDDAGRRLRLDGVTLL